MGQEKYWIFFQDKGFTPIEKNELIQNEKRLIPDRTLKRRAKVLSASQVVDGDDLPLYPPYLGQLNQIGVQPIVSSRWLNAISARLTEEQKSQVEKLSSVSMIKRVSCYRIDFPVHQKKSLLMKPQIYNLDYGESLVQNEIINVPEVHDLGLDGSDVIVGMLDTGFDYKYHEALAHLEVLAEYDFINNDSTTQNETSNNDASSQHNHGTYTLSALGGFMEGQLIGPAYGAKFLLAKTEDVRSETKVEEDYWAAGIEWLEREGADVVNSSLGYIDWYTYADMDGRTAVTTIAAEKAIAKGVVVVNSMGNEGNNSWRHMIAPADGFNVISAGAVYNTGDIVGFSSRGPTFDGRIKPDVMAMGADVYSAQPSTINSYRGVNGTSLSSPLIAGVAALVLQAHPYLTPYEVRQALRETADRAQQPDNDFGWGLVNAYEAIFYHGHFFSRQPEIFSNQRYGHLVQIKIYSKTELDPNSLFLYYAAANQQFEQVPLTVANEENKYQAWIPVLPAGTEVEFYFSADDVNGVRKLHPYNAPDAYFSFTAYDSTIAPINPPDQFRLHQNYPNPFDQFLPTTIEYDIVTAGKVTLTIFNIMGQRVRKLVNGEFHGQGPFPYRRTWDGRNDAGELVTSGIYFYRLQVGRFSATKRMAFLQRKK